MAVSGSSFSPPCPLPFMSFFPYISNSPYLTKITNKFKRSQGRSTGTLHELGKLELKKKSACFQLWQKMLILFMFSHFLEEIKADITEM